MPELPEVDTTRRGLESYLKKGKIQSIAIHSPKLRYPIDLKLKKKLPGMIIHDIQRRGKYLLFYCNKKGGLLWHLGMSGSLRISPSDKPLKKHDHVTMMVDDHCLRYNDPRRFGLLIWCDDFMRHRLLADLGPEPFSTDGCGKHIYQAIRSKSIPIKQVIMDHKIVVGVGNIYANEALFNAGINPLIPAYLVTEQQCQMITDSIKTILNNAIDMGGTTLRDFISADGKPGYFQQSLFVYGRAGEPCLTCKTVIQDTFVSHRRTFYCPTCQKKSE